MFPSSLIYFSVGVERICEYRDNILRETPLIPEEVFLSILVVPIFTNMLLSLIFYLVLTPQ